MGQRAQRLLRGVDVPMVRGASEGRRPRLRQVDADGQEGRLARHPPAQSQQVRHARLRRNHEGTGAETRCGTSIPGAPDAVKLANQGAKATGLYFVQYKRSGGGHIAAIEVESRWYHYFDANFGHFMLKDKARFVIWYDGFLTESGYKTRYTVKSIVTPVHRLTSGSVADLARRFGG